MHPSLPPLDPRYLPAAERLGFLEFQDRKELERAPQPSQLLADF